MWVSWETGSAPEQDIVPENIWVLERLSSVLRPILTAAQLDPLKSLVLELISYFCELSGGRSSGQNNKRESTI